MIVNKRINNKLLVISEYINELELDNCRLSNSDEILNNVIKEKDKEIDKLKKELEIEKDISDGMLETIDKAIEYIDRRDIEWGSKEHNKLLSILKGNDKE